MVRTVKGVTLTPEERRQAGYDKEKTQAHTCSVMLPNGVSCEMSYTRTSTRIHNFAFGIPLKRTQTVYEAIPGGTAGIEAKAASLGDALFKQAQHQEQQAMRQKTPASRKVRHRDDGPQMSALNAERLAGLYAPCVKNKSGTLIRVGGTYSAPEGALKELQGGRHSAIRLVNGQQFVVGICNRAAQQWEEPTFLNLPQREQPTSTSISHVSPSETEDLEGDEEDPNIAVGNQEGDPIGDEGGDDE
ncbi:MAG: hypothetical protein JWN14_2646 [Chthonomonadales bacterium]|nr:hypothetical protein [Chthonomonadales bacterium]